MKWFGRKRIYLDYASAPPVLPQATAAMHEAEKCIGNPGAIHREGAAAKKSLENSRARIAGLLGCKARELIFTSGLTESNNLAIIGYAKYLEQLRRGLKGTHWLVSSIEHDSVLESFTEVERMGGIVSHVEPDERGIISAEAVGRALHPETVFVSVGWANNEIGTVQPLAKIAQKIHEHEQHTSQTCVHKSDLCTCVRKMIFHSDAGQTPLYLPTVINSLGVDLLSLGGNKLYGPHGIGALYVSNDIGLAPVIFGGKQERGLRAGTESVALAAGFAAAFEVVSKERKVEKGRLKSLRDSLARELTAQIPNLIVNGDLSRALPHMLNVSIPAIQSEYVTLALDAAGIAVSTKSACREGEESRSHVVAALGGEAWRAANTIRFSLGRDTTDRDVRKTVRALVHILSTNKRMR
ncbi:cysteine desulfurase [Candidatus Kaiserbacteria bacterium]|nr:cysteine desulfurase [Candidatus Kaiserbacteria bacterium]